PLGLMAKLLAQTRKDAQVVLAIVRHSCCQPLRRELHCSLARPQEVLDTRCPDMLLRHGYLHHQCLGPSAKCRNTNAREIRREFGSRDIEDKVEFGFLSFWFD